MFVMDCCGPNLKAAALCARRQAMKQKYKRAVIIDLKIRVKKWFLFWGTTLLERLPSMFES